MDGFDLHFLDGGFQHANLIQKHFIDLFLFLQLFLLFAELFPLDFDGGLQHLFGFLTEFECLFGLEVLLFDCLWILIVIRWAFEIGPALHGSTIIIHAFHRFKFNYNAHHNTDNSDKARWSASSSFLFLSSASRPRIQPTMHPSAIHFKYNSFTSSSIRAQIESIRHSQSAIIKTQQWYTISASKLRYTARTQIQCYMHPWSPSIKRTKSASPTPKPQSN